MVIETLSPSTEAPQVRGARQHDIPSYTRATHIASTEPHDHIIATRGRSTITLSIGTTMTSSWTSAIYGLPMGSTGRVGDAGVVTLSTGQLTNGTALVTSSGIYPSILARVQKGDTATSTNANVVVYLNMRRS